MQQALPPALLSRYDFICELGAGSYGRVFKVITKDGQRILAIKHFESKSADESTRRARREIVPLRAIGRHENICTLHDFGRNWIALDYAEYDLYSVLATPQPKTQMIAYMAQILSGLITIHERGWIHRDIKPENILLTNNGIVKIADFGLATPNDNEPKDDRGFSLWWLPPEVAQGLRHYGPETDIYSLGCVFYEMMVGRALFRGPDQIQYMQRMRYIRQRPDRLFDDNRRQDRFPEFLDHTLPPTFIKAKPLLLAMLDWNPSMRPTAHQTLDWILGNALRIPLESYLARGPPPLISQRTIFGVSQHEPPPNTSERILLPPSGPRLMDNVTPFSMFDFTIRRPLHLSELHQRAH
jgi:serine/threonine protein kinase